MIKKKKVVLVRDGGGGSRSKKEKPQVLFYDEVGREEREPCVTWQTHSD